MFGDLFKGFQLLHALLLLIGAAGFFVFWARTRFWLPLYAHVLAAIGLIVGVWCVSSLPTDAPLAKQGYGTRLLFALLAPAMVYFFFVFYGGQMAARRRKPKTAEEIAGLIERFLNGTSLYPQEWNDFVDRTHADTVLDSYRKRCYLLDPRVNCLDTQDPEALAQLRSIVEELRTRTTLG